VETVDPNTNRKQETVPMEGAPTTPLANEQDHTDSLPAEVRLTPWRDEVVEAVGFGPRSMYVETCWLPVLGPTATWAYRRLGSWAEFNPDGATIDMVDLAQSLGLGESLAKHSKLGRTICRMARFDIARWVGDELQVRLAVAPLPERYVKQLGRSGRRLHESFNNGQSSLRDRDV
jgi:hypothetical protein